MDWLRSVTGCVQPVHPIIADCCWILRRCHWGELAHYTQADKNRLGVRGGKEEVRYNKDERKRPTFFSQNVFTGLFHVNEFSFTPATALPPIYATVFWKPRGRKHFTAFFTGEAERGTHCTDRRKEEREIYWNIMCWKSHRSTTSSLWGAEPQATSEGLLARTLNRCFWYILSMTIWP